MTAKMGHRPTLRTRNARGCYTLAFRMQLAANRLYREWLNVSRNDF